MRGKLENRPSKIKTRDDKVALSIGLERIAKTVSMINFVVVSGQKNAKRVKLREEVKTKAWRLLALETQLNVENRRSGANLSQGVLDPYFNISLDKRDSTAMRGRVGTIKKATRKKRDIDDVFSKHINYP